VWNSWPKSKERVASKDFTLCDKVTSTEREASKDFTLCDKVTSTEREASKDYILKLTLCNEVRSGSRRHQFHQKILRLWYYYFDVLIFRDSGILILCWCSRDSDVVLDLDS
jgi:hypothetical protein